MATSTESTSAASTPVELEYGYSHEGNYSERIQGYSPITPGVGVQAWFDDLESAIWAKWNDLRWIDPTFIISRPKPQGGQRMEIPAEMEISDFEGPTEKQQERLSEIARIKVEKDLATMKSMAES